MLLLLLLFTCAGLCFQEPALTPEDLAADEEAAKRRHSRSLAAAGEQARMRQLAADMAATGGAEAASAEGKAGVTKKAARPKKRSAPASAGGGFGAAAADDEDADDGEPAGEEAGNGAAAPAVKKLKLSTSVNLLDAKTARREAKQPRALQGVAAGGPSGGAESSGSGQAKQLGGALAGLPELFQRFLAGEGMAEPMPVQER